MNKPSAAGSSGERIAHALGRIALALRSRSWAATADSGLTPTQNEMLARIAEAPEGLSLGALAAQLGISAPTASVAVQRLVEKELVRKAAGADKRAIRLTVTRAGSTAARDAAGSTDFLAEAAAGLGPAEQTSFLVVLSKIIRALQQAGGISPQRMCVSCRYFAPYAHRDALNPHHCRFLDKAFGDAELRFNCADHGAAEEREGQETWERFLHGQRV